MDCARYANTLQGSIRLWDSKLETVLVIFNSHKSGVTCLAFDKAGGHLASGSRDTTIVIFDILTEIALYKLRGHTNEITGLRFLDLDQGQEEEPATNGNGTQHNGVPDEAIHKSFEVLLSVSKDALIKLWDLDSRHCGSQGPSLSMTLDMLIP